MFVYTNVTSGQVVESEHMLPYLDGLARWARSEKPKPTPAPASAAKVEPRKTSRNRKSAS